MKWVQYCPESFMCCVERELERQEDELEKIKGVRMGIYKIM